MPASEQPLTGFEGVQDSLLYDTLRQAQYQQRVLQQRQMENPFDRAIDAFGGLVSIGVDQIATPLAERNARAVSTARANALRSVEGRDFESPFARQIAVVEAAADELDSQGLGSSAEQLRANVLGLRQQQLQIRKLTGEADAQDLTVERLRAEKPHWAANFSNAALLSATQAESAVASLDEQLAGIDDRLAILKATRTSAEGEADSVGLKQQKLVAELEANRLQAQLARVNLEAAKYGVPLKAVTAPGLGVFSAMRQPDGSIRFTNPQTGKIETLPVGMYVEGELTGGQGDIASPNSPAGQAVARARAVGNLLSNAVSLRQNMRDNPNSRTFLARSAGMLDNLRSEVTTIQAQMPAAQAAADNKLFQDFFRNKNISNAVQQAQIMALAYGFARVYEPNAPALSSADVERGAAQVGGSSPTDAVTASVLDESIKIQMEGTLRELRTTGQPVPPALLDLYSRYKAIGAAPRPAPPRSAARPLGGRSAGPTPTPAIRWEQPRS